MKKKHRRAEKKRTERGAGRHWERYREAVLAQSAERRQNFVRPPGKDLSASRKFGRWRGPGNFRGATEGRGVGSAPIFRV